MGFSGIMEQKIQMKNMVRNYNPSLGTDRRRTQQLLLSPKMSYSIVGKILRLA